MDVKKSKEGSPAGERLGLNHFKLDGVFESGMADYFSPNAFIGSIVRNTAYQALAALPADVRKALFPADHELNAPVVEALERVAGGAFCDVKDLLERFAEDARAIATHADAYRQGVGGVEEDDSGVEEA